MVAPPVISETEMVSDPLAVHVSSVLVRFKLKLESWEYEKKPLKKQVTININFIFFEKKDLFRYKCDSLIN